MIKKLSRAIDWHDTTIFVFLTCHLFLCGINVINTSPTADEIGHLTAGVSHWQYGRFDLYRVNPPLIRMMCTIFVSDSHKYDWSHYSTFPGDRPEFTIGLDRLQREKLDFSSEFIKPRLLGLLLTAVGMLVGIVWLTQCFGKSIISIFFAAYWAFSPDLIAHGATIGPDVGAVAFGLIALFAYWRYTQKPSISSAALAGLGLGFAILCKLYWITGVLSLPVAVWGYFYLDKKLPRRPRYCVLIRDLIVSNLIVVLVVNTGYAFEDTMIPLGDYQFCSEMMGGKGASRFTPRSMIDPSSIWSSLPIPLPRNFLLGIDFLRAEVEEKKWSFLFGEWRFGSWSYYYLLTILIKTSEPALIAALIGTWMIFLAFRRGIVDSKVMAMFFILGLPSMVIFLSVSIQGGFNHHHRYVLPIYPFLFFLATFMTSTTAKDVFLPKFSSYFRENSHFLILLQIALCTLMIASTLRVHPHYTSYFNSISGGPVNGWRLLGFSNIDWGQDLKLVNTWITRHPECRPLCVDLGDFGFTNLLLDSVCTEPPLRRSGASIDEVRTGETQWWIVSVTKLYNLPDQPGLQYLQQIEPVERIAYAYHVYRIDPLPPEESSSPDEPTP
ncbi:MAG: ArnT family glycosyltransferase [Pirellula sp.]|jgi:hypothetical protein